MRHRKQCDTSLDTWREEQTDGQTEREEQMDRQTERHMVHVGEVIQ